VNLEVASKLVDGHASTVSGNERLDLFGRQSPLTFARQRTPLSFLDRKPDHESPSQDTHAIPGGGAVGHGPRGSTVVRLPPHRQAGLNSVC
jgi:hypothetical protein